MTSQHNIDPAIQRVLEAQTSDFVSLVKIAGLDPTTDLRYGNWTGLDLRRADLRGFDFTGADLSGVKFDGARIAGAKFDKATLDPSSLALAQDYQSPAPSPRLSWPRIGRSLFAQSLGSFLGENYLRADLLSVEALGFG